MTASLINFQNPNLNDPNLQSPNTFIGELLSRILIFSVGAAGIYFFVQTVVAGFTFLTSMGEPAKAQAAQQTLVHSLIGLIIVISAFFLAQLIETIFGVNILG